MLPYFIALSLALNCVAFVMLLVLYRKIGKVEKTPVFLDPVSSDRLEELVGTANKARKDLGHQVGLARVAIRDVNQAATTARAAAPRSDRKW